jgi:UDP:flavonoid glycosyltransferase YjiC (YdhE family)
LRKIDLPARELPPNAVAVDYAPYPKLFPKAAVIVHQGGIGTSGQTLQAGKPTLVVPFAHDQPDNAQRLGRLGTSKTLPFRRCATGAMTRTLEELLKNSEFAQRAEMIGRQVHSEYGVVNACNEIETLLAAVN